MADKFTETSTQWYFSRIWSSFKGIIVWLLLFFVSFWVLYWNEWRVNMSKVAKKATEINAQTANMWEHNWKLVAVSWELKATNPIWDTYLKEWSYLLVQRNVEVYSWKEKTSEKSEKNLWGSETTTTTYDYVKERQAFPDDSSRFKYPDGHKNLPKTIEDNRVVASDMKIWNLSVVDSVSLPWIEKIPLSEDKVLLQSWMTLWNWYIYLPVDPTNTGWVVQIWDQRISYLAVNNPISNATVFGKLDWTEKISPYIWPKDSKLYRAFIWTKDEAVTTLQYEHKVTSWMFRLAGFLMMWSGLTMLLAPITVILDVIPAIWKLGSWAISIVTFIIALILSAITILISMIIHNIWALIIVLWLAIWLIVYIFKKNWKSIMKTVEKKEKKAA